MAESTSGGEKTEQPTPKRLADARDEGQVCFSHEVTVAGLLLVGFCTMAATAPLFWNAMAGVLRHALSDGLGWNLDEQGNLRQLLIEHALAMRWLLPFLAAMFVAALVLCTAQVGMHASLKPQGDCITFAAFLRLLLG